MARPKNLHYLAAVWLAATAIVGLLAMHGMNPAVFQLGEVTSHDLAGVDDAGPVSHAAIGLCVFAVFGFVGLAHMSSTERRRNFPNSPRLTPKPLTRAPGLPAAGRQRLADLCVLRL